MRIVAWVTCQLLSEGLHRLVPNTQNFNYCVTHFLPCSTLCAYRGQSGVSARGAATAIPRRYLFSNALMKSKVCSKTGIVASWFMRHACLACMIK